MALQRNNIQNWILLKREECCYFAIISYVMLSYYHHFLINKRHPIEFQLCVLSFFNKSPSTRIIFHLDRNDLYLIKLINFIILFRFKHFTNKVSSSTCLWAVSIQFLYGNLIWFIFIAIHVIRLARIPFRFSWITLIHSLSSIFHFFFCARLKRTMKNGPIYAFNVLYILYAMLCGRL